MLYFDTLILLVVKKPVRIGIGHLIGISHGPNRLQNAKLNSLPFSKKRRSKRSQGHLKIYPISMKAIMSIKGGFETERRLIMIK